MTRIFILLIMTFSLTSFQKDKVKCSVDNLYGDWTFQGWYPGKIKKFENLIPNENITEVGPKNCTYEKSGVYIHNKGDHATFGKFTFDDKSCIIKKNDDKGDKVELEITHLDKQFLLVVYYTDISAFTYFYRRVQD